MAIKITKKEMFTKILAQVEGQTDLEEFVKHEIELLDNKRGKKSEKVSKEQASTDEVVLASMSATPSTVSEIYARMGKPDGYSPSKITCSLKRLIDRGLVENTKDGKSSRYSLV